jgi:hypothetical protein
LECINYSNDFSSHNWQSFPFHQYAQDSSGLPAELQGRLNASGIFYHVGSLRYENQIFFKDYHEDNHWGSLPTYLYLKYSTFVRSTSSQVLYVRPAHTPSGDLIVNLPLGSGYSWEETIVSIEAIDEMKTVEFGMRDFQDKEYLLVDKIAVVRAYSFLEVLRLLESCVEGFKPSSLAGWDSFDG